MTCLPENDAAFLSRPSPPRFADVKFTFLAVGALVLLSLSIDLISLFVTR